MISRILPLLSLTIALTASTARAAGNFDIAITVDDLPVHSELAPGSTRLSVAQRLLQALREERVPEVYGFVNASQATTPDGLAVLQAWVDAGYPLGNHTYSHPSLDAMDYKKFLKDVEANEPTLKRYTRSNQSYKMFRFPFLAESKDPAKREKVLKELKDMGYRVAEVTVDFADYLFNDAYAACARRGDRSSIDKLKQMYLGHALASLRFSRALSNNMLGREIRQVLLVHVGEFTSIMAADLLKQIRNEGGRFVGLTDALSDAAYSLKSRTRSEGGNFLDQINELYPEADYPTYPDAPEAALARMCR